MSSEKLALEAALSEYEKSPMRQLEALLKGKVAWDDANPAIQSAAGFHIYKAATAILSMQSKEERRAALKKIPSSIRPYVEADVHRRWLKERKGK